MDTICHWIDGRLRDGGHDRTDVTDPATGDTTAQLAIGGPAEVDLAVASAARGFAEWRNWSLSRRTRVLFAFRERLLAHTDDLARIITREHGKTIDDARGEITRGREVVDFACGLPHLLKGEFSSDVSTGVDTYSLRQPLGVTAGITPFNFPVMVPLWMMPMAIACGNAFVLKPSERDPSPSLMLAELLQAAGLPDGVFNVIQGDRGTVDALLVHPQVRSVSFVGSTPVAEHIYATATSAGKRVQALGGAKNHAVVLPDADVAMAADAIAGAAYGSAGQRCMAISAVVAVGDETADALVAALRDRAEGLTVGPGAHEGVDMAAVISAEQRDRVMSLVTGGIEQGAQLVVDGRDLKVDGYEHGYFVGPCLFDRVTTSMDIYTEEIFGPVLVVLRAETYAEALELVNTNPYGNGTAVFTNDGAAARAFEHDVSVGMVGINVPIPVPMAFYSFGGWKASLFGDLHVHGPEALRFYTLGKVVTRRWPLSSEAAMDLGFPTST